MTIWDRMKATKSKRSERVAAERIKDLELAASFVQSIETGHPVLNHEIQQVAERLQRIADQLGTSRSQPFSYEPRHWA